MPNNFFDTIPSVEEDSDIFFANIPNATESSVAQDAPLYDRPEDVPLSAPYVDTATPEQEALKEDWAPYFVPTYGVTIGAQTLKAGSSLTYALVRGGLSSIFAVAAEGTIVKPAEAITEQIYPPAVPYVGMAVSLVSAATIEKWAVETYMKATTKFAPKFWDTAFKLAEKRGILPKQFLDESAHIIKKMDLGDVAAKKKMFDTLVGDVRSEVFKKQGEQLRKMTENLAPFDLAPTKKIMQQLSKKHFLDDLDYRKLAATAERDAISEYTSEFAKVKTKIVKEQAALKWNDHPLRDVFSAIEREGGIPANHKIFDTEIGQALAKRHPNLVTDAAGFERPVLSATKLTELSKPGVTGKQLAEGLGIEYKGPWEMSKGKITGYTFQVPGKIGSILPEELTYKSVSEALDAAIKRHAPIFKPSNIEKIARDFGYDDTNKMFAGILSTPNKKGFRKIAEYEMRTEFDRIYKDEIFIRVAEKESSYLAKVIGVEKIGRPNIAGAVKAMSNSRAVESVVQEVSALRKTVQKISQIIRAQAKKELTTTNKLRLQRLRKTHADKLAEYRAAVKIKRDTAIIKKRLTRFATEVPGMRNEYREQLQNFLSPMLGGKRARLPESMFAFLSKKYTDEISIGTNILLKRFNGVIKSLPSRTHSFDKLTHNQVKDLDEFVKTFNFVAQNEKYILHEAKARLLDLEVADIVRTAIAAKSKQKFIQPRYSKSQLDDLAKGKYGAIGKALESKADLTSGFFASLKRFEPVVFQLDNFKEFGTAWKHIFNKVTMAEVAKERLGQRVYGQYKKVFLAHRSANKMGKFPGKYWDKHSGYLVGRAMNKETAVVMGLHSGHPDGMKAMCKGLKIAPEVMTKFLSEALNPADKKLITDIYDMLDDLFPIIAKVYKENTGLTLAKLKGGRYYPIQADKKYMAFDKGYEDLFLEANQKEFYATVRKTFTEIRVGGVKAVRLSIDGLTQHIEDVVHMSTHWKPLNEIQRLVKHAGFEKVVRETMGDKMYGQFDPWLKNLARPAKTAQMDWATEKSLSKVRGNVTTVLLATPKVGVRQTLSLITALPDVGVKNMVASLGKFTVNPRRFLRAVNEASPEIAMRGKTWHRDLGEMAAVISHKGNLNRSATRWYFSHIHLADRLTASVVWHGGYLKGLEEFGGNANRAWQAGEDAVKRSMSPIKNQVDEAIAMAGKIVRHTQPASAPKDLPAVMRSGEISRGITMFFQFHSVYHNQAMQIIRRGLAKNMSVPQVLSTLAFLATAPALAWHYYGTIWSKLTGRTPEEFDAYELAKTSAINMASGIPLARDLASSLLMGYDYQLSPIADVGKEFIDVASMFPRLVSEDEDLTREDYTSMAELGGYIFRLPSRLMITTVLGAQRLLNNETDDWSELIDRPRYEK